jgi:hypothetical protein
LVLPQAIDRYGAYLVIVIPQALAENRIKVDLKTSFGQLRKGPHKSTLLMKGVSIERGAKAGQLRPGKI